MTNKAESWETWEVITCLINDKGAYSDLLGCDQEDIRHYVLPVAQGGAGRAPRDLYASLDAPPASSWNDVDWAEVALSLADE